MDSNTNERKNSNGVTFEEKIKSLHTGAAMIGQASTKDELYNAVIKILQETLGYDLSGLAIPDVEYLHFVRTLHETHGTDFSLPLSAPSVSARALREKKTQLVKDVREDPDYYAGPQDPNSGPQALSSLVVPVLVGDEVRAILNLESTEPNYFAKSDVDILEILGMHIASAFERIDQIHEIMEGETRVQAIMNQAADAIILMDIKDRIVFWNPAAETMFNYSMKEALNETFYDLLVPDSFKEKYRENRKMLLGMGLDNDLPSMECICKKKTGEKIVVEVSHSMVQYDGKPHVLRLVRDASERKKYEQRLELLYQHSASLSRARNVYDIHKVTREATNLVFGVNHGTVALVENNHLVFVSDRPKEAWWRTPLDGKGISVRAVNTGEPQFVKDVRLDPDYVTDSTEVYDNETRVELDIPIKIDDQVVGVFNIESSDVKKFTDEDLRMVDILVESIASTLGRLRADEERKKYEQRLETLHRSALILKQAQTKEQVFEAIIIIIKEVLGTQWIGIAEPIEEGMQIALTSSYSSDEKFMLPYDAKSIVLRAYREKRTVFVEDLSSDPDYVSVEPDIVYVSELVVPVFVGEEIRALINIESTKEEELGESERKLVEILALHTAGELERIARTKELKESEERVRILSQNAVDAIFLASKDRDIISWNPSTLIMFGLDEQTIKSKKIEDLIVPPERRDAFFFEYNEIFERKGTGGRAMESVARRDDGVEIQVGFTASVIELEGKPHALFIMRDVTEQKEQQEKIIELLDQMQVLNKELERSNTDLENYTYVVSHDLKAPLRSIRSFGSFIMEDNSDQLNVEGKEYMDRIINAATHMDDLIGDLLLLSRVGRKFTEVEKIDVNELIDSIGEDIYATIQERNAVIVRDELPLVVGQKTWVRQLFMNLITNGLKFNKSEHPTITINVDETNDFYTFSINDNGIGISPEYHSKIFDLFERLHTKTEYEGTGAGLTICKKIVENLGGRLWVESDVGEGSTFYFTYPRKEVGA